MTDFHVCLFLLCLNVVQFVFWGVTCQKLMNKLMSRNYAEYDLVKRGPKAVPERKSQSEYEEELEESQILAELNGTILKAQA